MTNNSLSVPRGVDEATKEVLIAYVDAMILVEPIQLRLWQDNGVTLTQLSVLRGLRNGPQAIGRLGQGVGLAPASATRLVDRLERRGLVSRSRKDDDRRSVTVRLEPSGERLLGELRPLAGSHLQRAVERMSPGEREQVAAALKRLVNATRELALSQPGED